MPTTSVDCKNLNLDAIRKMPLLRQPFDYCIIPNVLNADLCEAIHKDFPNITTTGSFPIDRLEYGPAFRQLVSELTSKEFETVVAEKFNLDLQSMPQMLTVRGWCGKSDGKIHTDSREKVITVLLYLNETWTQEGGRLRILRSKDLEDYAAEIPPLYGQLLLFRRCDYSFHAHHLCDGLRRSMQLNWVKTDRYRQFERFRHTFSSLFKRNKSDEDLYYG